MKKLKMYIAVSLNFKIARADGKVDWLEDINHPEGEDYGYSSFYESIDTTIMGNNTYKEVLGFDVPFPYPDKKNYVLTRDSSKQRDEHVEYVSGDLVKFIGNLKKGEGKDIWLIGGGEINTLFLNMKLVDEMIIHIMPITIPEGINLFTGHPIERKYKLIHVKNYSSGVVELKYELS